MHPKSKKRFTLKIMTGYVALGLLAALASYFIHTEFKSYASSKNQVDENVKLLTTNRLLTYLYEAENLSKLALQTKKSGDLNAYSQKVDSINNIIDSLKPLVSNSHNTQISQLDSVQQLLQQKVFNNAELRKLKVQSGNGASFDSVLNAFHEMEVEMGRITPETFAPNFDQLPASTQSSIREYVAILNKNIPSSNGNVDANNIDSILQVSKSILNKAKYETAQAERNMFQKELQIYRTDLELSQKMRSIISGFEREMVQNAYLDNINQKRALKRSTRLAVGAIVLGLLIVILFTFLISKDYWKIQRYREQLESEKKYSESLLKSREQLISTVSHDLRTPLNTISGYSELMEHSGLSGKQLNYLKNVRSASGYVENLVNDLLDYSRLEAGKMHLEKVPFVLSNLIHETSMHFEDINAKKEVELVVGVDEIFKRPILGDPFRIRQILTNLIGNAFKFTRQGHVRVIAQLEEKRNIPWVKIEVEDTGIGIRPEKQELIFQEFTQAGSNTEKQYGGYGLGLTISKKLTELLGGTLSLKSEENQGSTFTVSLPVEFTEMAAGGGTNQEMDIFDGALSLCIIDDDTTLLELLKDICQTNHIDAQTHHDFDKLVKIGDLSFDMVLTDIQMPQNDGFTVLERLRGMGYEKPVIAMTGQKFTDKSNYLEAGFTDVLQKPFSNTSFLNVLARTGDFSPKKDSTTTKVPDSGSDHFNIKNIAPFLDSPNAVQDVLDTFLGNTAKNMESLSLHITNEDFSGIRAISHKMLPMFRQLGVHRAVPILERLEHIPDDVKIKNIMEALGRLETSVSLLEDAIREYLVRLPIGTD